MMRIQDKRQKNIDIFLDTKDWCAIDRELNAAIDASRRGTKVYVSGPITAPAQTLTRFRDPARVIVTQNRTLQAACQYNNAKVAVLNFASATNPGGGVTRGSSAQEEALCRCSTLYPCLTMPKLWDSFYQFHRNRKDALYTDACIYTPEVVVIKSDTASPERLPHERMRKVDVISCAAPNLRSRPGNAMNPDAGAPVHISDKELLRLHMERARKILTIAALHKNDVLVLGAFGCGAFRNPPAVVANAYQRVLPEFAQAFKTIEFAVYCPPNDTKNFNTFHSIIH